MTPILKNRKAWGCTWYKNTSADGGAQAYCINNLKDGEFCVVSHTAREGRMWSNVKPDELLKILQKNHGIFEVITPSQKRKVYFDIDCEPAKSDLPRIKNLIKERFPDASLAISGSHTEQKDSFHIVLTNYFFENQEAQKALVHWLTTLPSDLGFDTSVYTTNRNFKCINQSKLDGRVQAYISGAKDLKAHLVLYGFDDDAVDASRLEWFKSLVQSIEADSERSALVDVLDIEKQNLTVPEWFDWTLNDKTIDVLSMIPATLDYKHRIKIMCWAKYNKQLDFDEFWDWCKQKEDTPERKEKYQNLWNTKEYHYSDDTIFEILKRLYPAITKEKPKERDKFLEDSKVTPTSYTKTAYLSGDDLKTAFGKSQLVYVSLQMGRNKTGGTVEWLQTLPKTTKVLWISPRISYSKNVLHRLESAGLGFVNYTAIKSDHEKYNRIIMSPQSIYKTKTTLYDVVVYDEVESLKNAWSSDTTHRTHHAENWRRFVDITSTARYCLLMDALPTKSSISFYKLCRKTDDCEVLGSTAPLQERKIREFVGLKDFNANVENWKLSIINKIKNGKKLFIFYPWRQDTPSSSVIGIESFAKIIATASGLTSAMYRTYHGMTSSEAKAQLADVNNEWSSVHFVMSNTAITVGVNYDKLSYFDEIYTCYAGFILPRDVIQNMGRIRDNIPINIVYVPDFSKKDCLFPEIYNRYGLYKSYMDGYRYEHFSKGKTTFRELAKMIGCKFITSTENIDAIALKEMHEIEKSTECFFKWRLIPRVEPYTSKFLEITERVEKQEGTFDDNLALAKSKFITLFKDDTPEEVMEWIWNSKLSEWVQILYEIDDGKEPILSSIFGSEFKLELDKEYVYTENEFEDFKKRLQLRRNTARETLTTRFVASILQAVFHRQIWKPVYELDANGKYITLTTNEGKSYRKTKQITINGKNFQQYVVDDNFQIFRDFYLQYIIRPFKDDDGECLIDDDNVEYSTDF
jgi:hypothetical protein